VSHQWQGQRRPDDHDSHLNHQEQQMKRSKSYRAAAEHIDADAAGYLRSGARVAA
jgi:hypothetical protein